MSLLTTVKALLGSAWHVNSDAALAAMFPATDGTAEASKPVTTDASGNITMVDGGNIAAGTTTGTQIGTSASQKLGFYAATPAVQPSGAAQAAITDSSGGVASDTFAADSAYQVFAIRVEAADLANSQEYQFDPGFAGSLIAINARAVKAITTGAKAATITGRVNGGALGGGGVVALAGAYAIGAAQAGTAVTGAKAFTAGQTFGFTVGSVTTFVEGAFVIEFTLRNDSKAAALAKIAAMNNKFRTDLVALGFQKGSA